MAIYCYTNKGDTIERQYPMGKAPRRLRHKGKIYYHDIVAEQSSVGRGRKDTWPMRCAASGVDASQAVEATKAVKEQGFSGVTFDARTGDAIYESRRARKEYVSATGLHDRNAGYSDPVPP